MINATPCISGPIAKGGTALMSSSESLGLGSAHSGSGFQPTVHRQPWKGSTQSLKSHGSRQPCKWILLHSFFFSFDFFHLNHFYW